MLSFLWWVVCKSCFPSNRILLYVVEPYSPVPSSFERRNYTVAVNLASAELLTKSADSYIPDLVSVWDLSSREQQTILQVPVSQASVKVSPTVEPPLISTAATEPEHSSSEEPAKLESEASLVAASQQEVSTMASSIWFYVPNVIGILFASNLFPLSCRLYPCNSCLWSCVRSLYWPPAIFCLLHVKSAAGCLRWLRGTQLRTTYVVILWLFF